jgi:hypothetical protein
MNENLDQTVDQTEQAIRQILAKIQPEERRWVGLLTEILEGTMGGLMLADLIVSRLPPALAGQPLSTLRFCCERILNQVKYAYVLDWELRAAGMVVDRFPTFCDAFRRQRALEMEGVNQDFSISRVERSYRKRRMNGGNLE